MLEDIFFKKIPITDGGTRREVTMLEAILRQMAIGAAKGEMRHVDRVLKLLPILQETLAKADDSADLIADPAADMAVLEAIAEIFGTDPEGLFATAQEAGSDE